MMEEKDKLTGLETENEQLKEQLAALERELAAKQRHSNFRLLRVFVRTYASRPLYGSVSKLIDQLAERRIERDTIKDVLYATLRRLTRVGFITLMVALAPLSMAVLQTYYLKKQNEKLDIQNKRIEQQTYLQEAERRSSLVFLFDNVLDKIDDELRLNPQRRELSPQLIGRIVALTKALKPYRFLEGDSITPTMSSPERGQVLLSVLASKLHRNSYDQIFLLADFSYATLQNVNLDGAYLRNINLSNAVLESVSLTGADLRQANFSDASLTNAHVQWTGRRAGAARFDFANFHRARVLDSDLGGSSFKYANFSEATLRNVTFQRSMFHAAKFEQVRADSLDFSEALFLKTIFSSADNAKPLAFKFANIQLDSTTLGQIRQLLLASQPVPDRNRRKQLISRDTFYVDDKGKPVIVVDSVELFGVQ